jgi:hypothetical protein
MLDNIIAAPQGPQSVTLAPLDYMRPYLENENNAVLKLHQTGLHLDTSY